jgi:hypothetical protein
MLTDLWYHKIINLYPSTKKKKKEKKKKKRNSNQNHGEIVGATVNRKIMQ